MPVLNSADNLYLGSSIADRVYLGTNLVWPGPLRALIRTLFGNGEQGAFYIPMPVVNGAQALFQDSAGTVPVTADGDPDGLMIDQSPNSNNAAQSVSAERPAYTLANGLDFLLFDQVDDYLLLPFIAGDADNFVFSIAVTPETANPNARYFGLVGSGINLQCGYDNDGTIFTRVAGSSFRSAFKVTIGNTFIVSHIRQAGVSSIRINGADVTVNSGGAPAADSLFSNTGVLGAGYQPDNFKLKGKIHAALFRYGSITEGQLSDIDKYFASVAGITL